MDFTSLFEMQGMLFLILALGLILRKINMINDGGKSLLSNLVMNVTLPASILKSFQMEFSQEILIQSAEVLVAAVVIQFVSQGLSTFLYPGRKEDSKRVLQYATIVSNAGVFGNAIAEGIFGDLGVMYASIYTIPLRIFMWSVGLTYFTKAPSKKELVRKVVTHPCIIAIFVGMLMLITQVKLPGFVNLTIKTVGSSNTFVAMLLIGCSLAEVSFMDLMSKEVFYYTFIRLFLLPFIVLMGCRLVHLDELVTEICTVLSAMPAANTTVVMAIKYKSDELLATKIVVFSTLLSMATLPLWCYLIR